MTTTIELKKRVIKGSGDGPRLLIVGGVHGDEYESMVAIRRLIRLLDQTKDLRGRLTFVPVVNEAAYQRSQRTAEDGKDLARTCPGSATGTITERTADALSKLIRDADFFVDLHTGGTIYDLVPLSGYTMHPDERVLYHQRQMAQAFNVTLIWGTSPLPNGRSLSVARDEKVPGIYAEHGGAANCTQQGVRDYVDGCLNIMGLLGMIKREQPVSRVQWVIEDVRDQSGHLQIQHPSPAEGYFEPCVELGQFVKAGEPIGHVSDVLGERVTTVPALQTGIVIMLRTVPFVREKDALAAMVEFGQTREGMTWRIGR